MIQIDGKKDASLVTWLIKRPATPKKVRIFLNQKGEADAVPCVMIAQEVRVGQKIAEPGGPSGVAVHASVSGKITAIGLFRHPLGGQESAVEIHSDEKATLMANVGKEREGWDHLPQRQIGFILQDSGVVGMSSMEPVHVKCSRSRAGKISTLILNGCESEPYLTCDHALMLSHAVEILKGAEILRKFAGAEKIVIMLEDNKLEAAELLKSKAYFLKWDHVEVKILKTRYPQGLSPLLIQKTYPREEEDGRAPALVHSVATAFSVYEAVVMNKPLYERAVTIGGECVVDSYNVWAPIGVSFGDAFKFCRGLLREPRKVLMNGPMMGAAQEDLNASVVPGTKAILALPKEAMPESEIQPCIRCNQCVDACPVDISPVMITLAAEKDEFEIAAEWGAEQCIECGACSYVCPAKRPMLELIQYASSNRVFPSKKLPVSPHEGRPLLPLHLRKKKMFAESV